jgi:hypothetical protein
MLRILALSVALAGPAVDLPDLFAEQIPKVKDRSEVPVLLPQTMPSDFDALFPSVKARTRRWDLDVGAAPDCGGSTACFVAAFTGRRGGTPFGKRAVDLAAGRTGRFQPLSCGASCSPPSISWRERGATFSIQAKVAVKGKSDRRVLTRMANSAIRNGPR